MHSKPTFSDFFETMGNLATTFLVRAVHQLETSSERPLGIGDLSYGPTLPPVWGLEGVRPWKECSVTDKRMQVRCSPANRWPNSRGSSPRLVTKSSTLPGMRDSVANRPEPASLHPTESKGRQKAANRKSCSVLAIVCLNRDREDFEKDVATTRL